eukprot:CAMPEP_0177617620 /NCGR_PEP_ID=MMETSP0419_2-20121207/25020_1 /TAXON_ID=582737 /ORGANISM="Tetraselmis sp., Strain GSL018" /LENGTH=261 /DNA_ID=CAMNT_0019116225 /DNA_START=136 /DNA_END=921 /DNA_ORIENTATION=+
MRRCSAGTVERPGAVACLPVSKRERVSHGRGKEGWGAPRPPWRLPGNTLDARGGAVGRSAPRAADHRGEKQHRGQRGRAGGREREQEAREEPPHAEPPDGDHRHAGRHEAGGGAGPPPDPPPDRRAPPAQPSVVVLRVVSRRPVGGPVGGLVSPLEREAVENLGLDVWAEEEGLPRGVPGVGREQGPVGLPRKRLHHPVHHLPAEAPGERREPPQPRELLHHLPRLAAEDLGVEVVILPAPLKRDPPFYVPQNNTGLFIPS